jgi:hypothetical protein
LTCKIVLESSNINKNIWIKIYVSKLKQDTRKSHTLSSTPILFYYFKLVLVLILYKVTNLSPYATLLSSNNIAITFIVVPINWVGINIQHRNKCSPTPPINMKINMKIEQFFIVMSGQLKIVACSYYPYGWTQCLVPHSIFTLFYCYPYSNLMIHMFLEMLLKHPHSYWVFKHALVFFTSIYLHILSPTHKLEIV